MQETVNYKLKKPEYNEYADIQDINTNIDEIDKIIKNLETSLSKVLTKEQTDAFYAKLLHRHNVSDIDNLIPTIQQTKVNNAVYADNAGNSTKLNNQNWYWSGQNGQPQWVWGGSDGQNMYVYNPANFNVNSANSVQGFQFRNNGGKLEILINGVWLSVGAKQYTIVRQGAMSASGQRFDYSGSAGIIRNAILYQYNQISSPEIWVDGQKLEFMNGSNNLNNNTFSQIEFKNSVSILNGSYNSVSGNCSVRFIIQTEY